VRSPVVDLADAPPLVDHEQHDQQMIDDTAERLRLVVARLARLLRQQDQGGFGPTMTAALASVAKLGPITLGELATRESVAPPTITKVVEKMVTAGLVTRTADPDDRRVCRLVITAAGRRQLEDTRHRRAEWLRNRMQDLTAAELAQVAAAAGPLEKLTEGGGS
jgi:DNA-binding MarR family transcriptional regulator